MYRAIIHSLALATKTKQDQGHISYSVLRRIRMSPWIPSPPRCPRFTDANPSLFDRYSEFIRDVEENSTKGRPTDWRLVASALASDLHLEAVSLGMNKAYEYSDDIFWLEQCAAIVTLAAFGERSPSFEKYQAAVHYYRAFPSTAERVAAFDGYVQGA